MTHHKTIVSPTSKLHHTLLLVKWKILHIDATVGFVDGGRVPLDLAIVVKNGLGHDGDLVVAVSTKVGKLDS